MQGAQSWDSGQDQRSGPSKAQRGSKKRQGFVQVLQHVEESDGVERPALGREVLQVTGDKCSLWTPLVGLSHQHLASINSSDAVSCPLQSCRRAPPATADVQ